MPKKDKEKKSKFSMASVASALKKQPSEEPKGSSEGSGKAVAANNRKSSPLLHETVFETVAGICRKNKLFVVRRDDEDLYVGIYLNLDDIGGLSAKMKDESKGSMVSQINAGHISVMFNSDLDAQNGLVFIPTESTISHMMEYALLREGRTYALVLIDSQGEGDFEKTDVFVDLEFLEKCHTKKIHIKTKLGKYLEDVVLDSSPDLKTYGAPPVRAPEPEPEPEPEPFESGSGDEDPFGDSVFAGADMGDEGEYSPFDASDSGFDAEDYGEGSGGGYGEPDGEDDLEDDDDGDEDGYGGEESDEPVIVDHTIVKQVVSRRFFNDDFSAELDTAGLDAALAGYAEFRPIPMQPPGSWQAAVINPLIAAANQSLFDLHKQHLGEVQSLYLDKLEAAYLEQMSKLQAPEIRDTLAGLQEQYMANKTVKLPEAVAEKEAAARADWEKRVKEYGEAARVAAEQSYKTKYQQQFEEAYNNIRPSLERELDTEFARAQGKYLSDEKGKLYQALDIENSRLVREAVAAYRALMPAEQELLEYHQGIITAALSEVREEEMRRIRVLGDELARDGQIETLTQEYNAKIEAMSSEFNGRMSALRADMEQAAVNYRNELAAKDDTLAEVRRQHMTDRDDWSSHTNELLTQIRELNESRDRDVQIRTAEMRAERDSYSEKYTQLQNTQKHMWALMGVVVLVSVIAALCLGALIGVAVFGGKSDDKVPDTPPAQVATLPEDGTPDVVSDNVDDPSGVADNQSGEQGEAPPVGQDVPDGQTEPPVQDGLSDTDWSALQDPVL